MKVRIGKYINWIGPHQIADKIFFWCEKYPTSELEKRWDYKAKDRFTEFLAGKDDHATWFAKVCNWIYKKRKRTVKVKIDRWDTWSMDHTLAFIIHPMLLQLKKTKHGSPYVDDDDVPEELKSTSALPKENEYDVDSNHFKRWDYVLDEMIWSFEQLILDEEPDFWIVEPKGMHFIDSEVEGVGKCSEMKWEVEGEYDWDAATTYQKRKDNGFKLFGKYYRGLWD